MIAAVVARRPILRTVGDVLTGISRRNYGYARFVSATPRVRTSFPEKVAHGIAIFIACSAIPAWVSMKLPEYRGAEEEDNEE